MCVRSYVGFFMPVCVNACVCLPAILYVHFCVCVCCVSVRVFVYPNCWPAVTATIACVRPAVPQLWELYRFRNGQNAAQGVAFAVDARLLRKSAPLVHAPNSCCGGPPAPPSSITHARVCRVVAAYGRPLHLPSIMCPDPGSRPLCLCPGPGSRPLCLCPDPGSRPLCLCPGPGSRPPCLCPGPGSRPLCLCPDPGSRPLCPDPGSRPNPLSPQHPDPGS